MSSSAVGSSLAPWRRIALACHSLLVVTIAATGLGDHPSAWRLLAAAVIVAPLLATLPGLARGQRQTERWLAVLLVLYAGATSVEVVARAGAPLVSTALLAAVAELGVLLVLIRRSPTAHG